GGIRGFHVTGVQTCALPICRLAGALTGLGLKRGDRVGIVVEIEPRAIECLLAPLRAGLVLVPMNPRLHASEYAFMLRKCSAKAQIGRAPCRRSVRCTGDGGA